MIKEYKVPSPGESITEVEITTWMVENGAFVNKNDELAEVESDKATLILVAEESGTIDIKIAAGITVAVGQVAYTINTDNVVNVEDSNDLKDTIDPNTENIKNESQTNNASLKITPVAAEMMKENNLTVNDVVNGLKRLSKNEVQAVLDSKIEGSKTTISSKGNNYSRNSESTKITMLRKRLSERLVAVKNETAMLTTFNEVDMSSLMELKTKYQTKFTDKHGFKPGFMGFFTKAVSIAAFYYPMVNSQINNDEIIIPGFVDVGIAVQSPKGLMVPIIRNAESKSVVELEKEIKELAQKARDKKITIEELSGGTISITNGGVFGSLLSTPIINPPQSAILGMHNIVDRPIALNGQVVIRPMMYIALSYDHRIIDGKDSVGFLKMVKELIENPERMMHNGIDPKQMLLEI